VISSTLQVLEARVVTLYKCVNVTWVMSMSCQAFTGTVDQLVVFFWVSTQCDRCFPTFRSNVLSLSLGGCWSWEKENVSVIWERWMKSGQSDWGSGRMELVRANGNTFKERPFKGQQWGKCRWTHEWWACERPYLWFTVGRYIYEYRPMYVTQKFETVRYTETSENAPTTRRRNWK
jgi:hypothetical protein